MLTAEREAGGAPHAPSFLHGSRNPDATDGNLA